MKRILLSYLLVLCCGAAMAQSVPANVPTNGLVAYYGFDGNANDYSGNGNNGTLQTLDATTPQPTADRFGNANSAYLFGGMTNQNFIEVPASTSLRLTSGASFSFWFKQTSSQGGNIQDCTSSIINDGANFTIMSRGGCSRCGGDPGMIIENKKVGNSQLIQLLNNNTTDYSNTLMQNATYNCYALGEWVHCVMTNDNSGFKLYINGILYTSYTASLDFTQANNHDLMIGITDAGGVGVAPFSGCIDDIAIYNRALTAEEVKSLFGNYVDPNTSEQPVRISSVDVVNPCGNSLGTITLNPTPRSGVTYKYSGTSIYDLQTSNVISSGPGTVHAIVASECRVWDTTITLICSCSDSPTNVDYQTICPGVSGQTGSANESIVSQNFDNSADGWTTSNYWARATGESNYQYMGLSSAYHSAHSGRYAFFCSNLQTMSGNAYITYPTTTSNLTSSAITIPYNPSRIPITATFSFFSTGFGSDATGTYYNSITLQYATSPTGPWTRVWGISGGGYGLVWNDATVSLSSYLPSAGTYYFRFVCEGAGYCSGIDDFAITADTRWIVPDEVTNGDPGTTVRSESIQSSDGTCPITNITYWTILDTVSRDSAEACDSSFWRGEWRYQTTDITEQLTTRLTATAGPEHCDSMAHHHLTVYSAGIPNVSYDTACDAKTIRGTNYTSSAQIGYTVTTEQGCTGLDSIYLTIYRSFRTDANEISCDPITWYGNVYENSIDTTASLKTIHGCDSVMSLKFRRYHKDTVRLSDAVCEGTAYYFAGRSLTASGNYEARLSNVAGCDSMVYLTFQLINNPKTDVSFVYDCPTNSYTLTGTTDRGYAWWYSEPADTNLAGHETDGTITVPYRNGVRYIYHADLDSNGTCAIQTVINLPRPVETKAIMTVHPERLTFDQMEFTAIDGSKADAVRTWYVNDMPIKTSGRTLNYEHHLNNSPTYHPEEDTVVVTLVIDNGGCYDTATRRIPLHPVALYVPNVFIPVLPEIEGTNNEHINIFRARGIGITEFEIHIFARTGQLVYHSKNMEEGWDGYHGGTLCPTGVYTYIIRYRETTTPGNLQVMKGTVTLLH